MELKIYAGVQGAPLPSSSLGRQKKGRERDFSDVDICLHCKKRKCSGECKLITDRKANKE